MSGLQVLGDRVLVEPISRPTVSDSGIELTDREPPTIGRVVALGTRHQCPECGHGMPIELRLGAIVGFSATAGYDVPMDDALYTVLRLDDVQFEWTPDTARESA